MKLNHLLSLQRLVAKIDNDFNIDNSDWIPRVAAWTIDALSQLKCLPYTWKRKKCVVNERIAYCDGILNSSSVRVYTQKGCLIKRAGYTDVDVWDKKVVNPEPFGINEIKAWSDEEIAIFQDDYEVTERLKVGRICHNNDKNFVLIDDDKIEINFDADWIVVEYFGVATYYDEYFRDEVPYVYDNGILLEALAWYVLYKILSRGYKHQIFSLSGQEPVNPYTQWKIYREKAEAAIKHDLFDADKNQGWNNFFYNSTFLPRR